MKQLIIEDVLKSLKNPSTEAKMRMVRLAYAVAEKAHGGQNRRCGHVYFQHPLAVAKIVAEIGLGT